MKKLILTASMAAAMAFASTSYSFAVGYSDLPNNVRNAFGAVSAGCGKSGSGPKCAAALAALQAALKAANLNASQLVVAAQALRAVSSLPNAAAASTELNAVVADVPGLADEYNTPTGSITPDEVVSGN